MNTKNISFVAVTCSFLLASGIQAAPGDLDVTFGGTGIITTDFFGDTDNATAVAVQPDGKVVAAGWVQSGPDTTTADFAVARYLSDGTLDPEFGTGGMVTCDFAGSTDLGHAVAIQSDGKIIVAGEALSGAQNSFALVRYNDDGSIDTTFGNEGKVLTPFSDRDSRAYEIVVQPDQKIVVAATLFRPRHHHWMTQISLSRDTTAMAVSTRALAREAWSPRISSLLSMGRVLSSGSRTVSSSQQAPPAPCRIRRGISRWHATISMEVWIRALGPMAMAWSRPTFPLTPTAGNP